MGVISRLYNFVAGTPAVADQVDAEFDQILGVLNGNVDAANLAAGGVTKAKLATDALNNFLKLASTGDHKIAFGVSTLSFPGSSQSSQATIPHGLGATPVAWLALSVAPSGNIADAVVINETQSPTSTNFFPSGRTVSGASVGPGNLSFYWIAIS